MSICSDWRVNWDVSRFIRIEIEWSSSKNLLSSVAVPEPPVESGRFWVKPEPKFEGGSSSGTRCEFSFTQKWLKTEQKVSLLIIFNIWQVWAENMYTAFCGVIKLEKNSKCHLYSMAEPEPEPGADRKKSGCVQHCFCIDDWWWCWGRPFHGTRTFSWW